VVALVENILLAERGETLAWRTSDDEVGRRHVLVLQPLFD
jgi:hypothetical protein